jgi:hypothetical protein
VIFRGYFLSLIDLLNQDNGGAYGDCGVEKGVYWVGAIDWNIRDFHGYSTPTGTTYNAYLILDEKCVLVDTVKAPSMAFRDREMSIDVTIKSYGYTGLTVPLILKEGNKLLVAKNFRINENPAEVTVSLPFIPEKVGQHNLDLSIPSQFGESLTSNNNVIFPLKVVRDKIRILMISGSPSLNYRFMRMALN